jgi:hypothetical protein
MGVGRIQVLSPPILVTDLPPRITPHIYFVVGLRYVVESTARERSSLLTYLDWCDIANLASNVETLKLDFSKTFCHGYYEPFVHLVRCVISRPNVFGGRLRRFVVVMDYVSYSLMEDIDDNIRRINELMRDRAVKAKLVTVGTSTDVEFLWEDKTGSLFRQTGINSRRLAIDAPHPVSPI